MHQISSAIVVFLVLAAASWAKADDGPGAHITMAAFGDRVTNADQTNGDTWDSAWLAEGTSHIQFSLTDGDQPNASLLLDRIQYALLSTTTKN